MFFAAALRFGDGERHLAARHRDVVFGQNGLGLILVNFHGYLLVLVWRNSQTFNISCRFFPTCIVLSDEQRSRRGRRRSRHADHPARRGQPAQIAGISGGAADEGRDRGGAGRLRARHARGWRVPVDPGLNGAHAARYLRHRRRRRAARSIFRLSRRSWWRARACTWPSTATARISSQCGSADLLEALGHSDRAAAGGSGARDPRGRASGSCSRRRFTPR